MGKLNGWVLELSFAGQIVNFKFLFWIIHSFIKFNYFSIYSSAFIYSFIHSFIDVFIFGWVLLILSIVNRQSNLIIYIEFVLYKFYVSLFSYLCVCMCLCLCVFQLVFVCIYVLPATSLLFAFVLYLFWLCFSKMIRVIHYFYPLKNPWKREESLLGIFSLESQTSFSCN